MGYSIDAIKARLAAKSDQKGGQKGGDNKTKYFKPVLGPNNTPKEYDFRFSPVANGSGEPIQTISNYKKLANILGTGGGKLIAPSQFGMEDPIATEFEQKRNHPKGKNASEAERKESWAYAKNLKAEDFCAAQVLDRANEEEGWLLWEFNSDFRDVIYGLMMHKDYVNEQLFDADSGYDFTLTVSHKMKDGKPEYYNNYPCKDLKLVPRRKSSKLHDDKKIKEALLKSAINLEEYYKKMIKTPDELKEMLQTYKLNQSGGAVATPTKMNTPVGTDHSAMRGVTQEVSTAKAIDDIEASFDELKNDDTPF